MIELRADNDPAKYFVVPEGKPFDIDTYETIMDRVEFLNHLVEDLADGCDITYTFNDNTFNSFATHMITSYLYMAGQLVENSKLNDPVPTIVKKEKKT